MFSSKTQQKAYWRYLECTWVNPATKLHARWMFSLLLIEWLLHFVCGSGAIYEFKWPKSIKKLDTEVVSGTWLIQECQARARNCVSMFGLYLQLELDTLSPCLPFWLHSRFCLWQDYGTECSINDSLCTATFPQSLYEECSLLFFSSCRLVFLYSTFLIEVSPGYKTSFSPTFDRNTVSVSPWCLDFSNVLGYVGEKCHIVSSCIS